MQIVSHSLHEGRSIPEEFTTDGSNVSPDLTWSQIPSGTEAFAIVVDDPDAPSKEPWVHWLVYDIPKSKHSLNKGENAGTFGQNSWGHQKYDGPKPPKGTGPHRYRFSVYALKELLNEPAGLTRGELEKAMKGKTLGKVTLTGIYEYH